MGNENVLTDDSIKTSVTLKINSLTTKEKIRLLTGRGAWHTDDCHGKLPSIMMTDGPHGLRKQDESLESLGQNNQSKIATCFPTASAIACSWDTEILAKMAAAIADEAIAEDVSLVLGPGVNMKRSPLCGRNFEYFSEDPFLAGTLGAAYINAMQEKGVGTSLKHFAGNSQETHRMTANSQIDERALHEIYLAAFELAVKQAQPASVMASYNRINGEYSCASKWLLTDLLRDKWGYQGAVISDWGAAVDVVKCYQAGMDLEMPDSCGIHSSQVLRALNEGKISQAVIDQAATRVATLAEKYEVRHLDRHVYTSPTTDLNSDNNDPGDTTSNIPANSGDSSSPVAHTLSKDMLDDHHQLAKDLAAESAVLLKNDGILPLPSTTKKVVVIGEMAEQMRFQGGGSSHISTSPVKNVVKSFQAHGIDVIYEPGYFVHTDLPDSSLEQHAIRAIRTAKEENIPILFFGGLTEDFEGEGYDRKNLEIPGNQISLFLQAYSITSDIVFISFGGSAMDLNFATKSRAMLHLYLGGQAVGEACVDLLLGIKNPCGKLAETFPLKLTDVPSYHYFATRSDDVTYRESLFVGYRYYDTYNVPVLFPFGHGLSYTKFAYSDLSIDQKHFSDGTLAVSVWITNVGTCFGKEIVELYVKNPACDYLRPKKELRGFAKIALEPGEYKCVTILLSERSFSIYDEEKQDFIMPSGTYEVLIGSSSTDIRLSTSVTVSGVTYTRNDREKLAEYFSQSGKDFSISESQFETLYGRPLSHFDSQKRGDFSTTNSLEQLAKHSLFARFVLFLVRILVPRMFKGKSKQDPEVMMMMQGILEGTIDCVICQSGGILPYKVAESMVLSANGHRLKAFAKLFERKGGDFDEEK